MLGSSVSQANPVRFQGAPSQSPNPVLAAKLRTLVSTITAPQIATISTLLSNPDYQPYMAGTFADGKLAIVSYLKEDGLGDGDFPRLATESDRKAETLLYYGTPDRLTEYPSYKSLSCGPGTDLFFEDENITGSYTLGYGTPSIQVNGERSLTAVLLQN